MSRVFSKFFSRFWLLPRSRRPRFIGYPLAAVLEHRARPCEVPRNKLGVGNSNVFLARGSTMARTLQFPSQPASAFPASSLSEDAVSIQRRILIAEDNELTRQQLQELLETDPKVKVDTT